uniref:CUB domain-containing protein n=1 Tax=Neogobius melanostomus TaxID=47308 RepID=A0A8C6WU56_9GOBI
SLRLSKTSYFPRLYRAAFLVGGKRLFYITSPLAMVRPAHLMCPFQSVSCCFVPGCGATMTSPSGVIVSPGHPNTYPHGANCTWFISVAPGNLIRLTFDSFNLEYHSNCNFDYVEDGGYENSPLIGRWCGTSRPPVLVSHSNRFWVRFRTDSSVTRRGFTAHWDGCGGSMTSASGGFSSPGYPLPYHPNAECYWSIRTSPGSKLLLSFSDFHLETSSSCNFDYLAVYDGDSSSATQLAQLCGSQPPSPIGSSSNQLYVKLRTDSSVSAGGFLAKPQDGSRTCVCVSDCSGIRIENQHRGELESLNFPNEYPHNSLCSWTVLASSGNNISYSFSAFELEGSPGYCPQDYVKVRSTTSSAFTLVFRSDGSVTRLGFQMIALSFCLSTLGICPVCSSAGCGGELHGPAGFFNSPGYPDKYPENRECVWYIRTAASSSITITIYEFDVEFHPNCNYDVLEVFGGPDLQAPQLAKLCTTTSNPMQISSTGNTVTVRFTSDVYISGRGFNASWAEVPGGTTSLKTADKELFLSIHSPSYPSNYPHNVDCSWVISVDPSHRVLFNFSDLDIEFHSNCTWDYVAVYDGPSMSSPPLARICGTTLPPAITSTSNTIYVRFRSDSTRNHRGFRKFTRYTSSQKTLSGVQTGMKMCSQRRTG